MLDLFKQELKEHLSIIDNILPDLDKTKDKKKRTELSRAAHSIRGAAKIRDMKN